MKYPPDMDDECVALCDALNTLPGVATTESCCGHGIHPFRVFFSCTSFDSLKRIAECTASSSWHVEALYHNGPDTLGFLLEGAIDYHHCTRHLIEDLTTSD
jgi:hypothetical protein